MIGPLTEYDSSMSIMVMELSDKPWILSWWSEFGTPEIAKIMNLRLLIVNLVDLLDWRTECYGV